MVEELPSHPLSILFCQKVMSFPDCFKYHPTSQLLKFFPYRIISYCFFPALRLRYQYSPFVLVRISKIWFLNFPFLLSSISITFLNFQCSYPKHFLHSLVYRIHPQTRPLLNPITLVMFLASIQSYIRLALIVSLVS